jgi:lipid-binding SYLF domain-containing protein
LGNEQRGKNAMGKSWKWFLLSIFAVQIAILAVSPQPAVAASASQISSNASAALTNLYNSNPAAAALAQTAKAILVFPSIVKGGFLFGAQYGQGVLFMKGRTTGYYQSSAVSYGLQAGIQSFGYTLFLMTDQAMQYVNGSNGWELGVGPSVVVVDQGMARSMTTTTLRDDVYAFIFNQQGLMAGMGLQGSKISPYTPDE